MREITKNEFGSLVNQTSGVVLIDFQAKRCSPCASLRPQLEELSMLYKDRVNFLEVDVDKESDFTAQLGIRSVPTVLLFVNGQLKEKIAWREPIELYKEKIEFYSSPVAELIPAV